MRAASLVLAQLVLVACGGVPRPSETVAERFDAPEAAAAKERAPDMYASAERARRDAERAEDTGDAAAAADHATRARLLLAAAVAESDRLALEEQRLDAEAREREAEEQVVRNIRAREDIAVELAHREASRVAAERAAIAFQRAATEEGRRYRGQSAERDRLRRDAAAVLSRRAQLLVAAAQAMDAEPERINAVATLLEEASRAADGEEAIRKAERALHAAMSALGGARAAAPGPTPDEHAALIVAATQIGAITEQRDIGLVVRITAAFRGNGQELAPATRRRLALVAALVTAHPHGLVQVNAFSVTGNTAARQRAADRRAAAYATALVEHGAPDERLRPEGAADVAGDANDVELVFLSYGPVR